MDSTDVISSTYLFKLNKMKITYEEEDTCEVLSFEDFKKGLAQVGIKLTFYDRIPKFPSSQPEVFHREMNVKFIDRIKQQNGGTVYFFVYESYDAKIKFYREALTKNIEVLNERPEFKVRYLAAVSVGGLFGLLRENQFIRVRVTVINMATRQVNFWAVDEGFFGDCPANELFFLNDFCILLDMLVVPGIMVEEPTGLLKEKVSNGEMCKAVIVEPILHDDNGPRKIKLID